MIESCRDVFGMLKAPIGVVVPQWSRFYLYSTVTARSLDAIQGDS
jgi:hypothetical protein